jgi:type IV secretory pathway VirJ component
VFIAFLFATALKLPIIEVPATKGTSDTMVVFVSGDGGWAAIDKSISKVFADNGMPVVGLNALQYFWKKRTPEAAARDLQSILETYMPAWKKNRVMLVGYSRGADSLPFMVSRLPEDLRASIGLIALLGLEPFIDFKYTPFWSLSHLFHREPQVEVLPEMKKLRGANVVCVYGEKEKDSLCPSLEALEFKIVRQPGGHHFAGRYEEIAKVILRTAGYQPAGPPATSRQKEK